MKTLLLVTLVLLASCKTNPEYLEPDIHKGQAVRFTIPKFLEGVCSGNGVVTGLECLYGGGPAFRCPYNSNQRIYYVINTSMDEQDCPTPLTLPDYEVRAAN